MPDGGVALVLARAVFVTGLLSLGGVTVFAVLVARPALAPAPPDEAARVGRMLRHVALGSLVFAMVALAGWTLLQSAAIAGAGGPGQAMAALRPVLGETAFGHLALLQFAALAATVALLHRDGLSRGTALAALFDVALQAGHGHAMAMDGVASLLCIVDILHLLAAAAWIGGLLPLLLLVRLAAAATAAQAARWFSPMGRACVVVLAGSALVQGWVLVGGWHALTGTAYGWTVLVKATLFLLLTALALLNRYRLAPALRKAAPSQARRDLLAAILVQTGLGLLAVLASAWLSGLTPGMDMGQEMSATGG